MSASTRWGLGPRLMLALALVLLVGGLTAAAVALAVGPGVFHEHMVRAGVDDHDAAVLHAEEAFRSAGGWSLALALGAAAVTSLAVCALLTRRVGRSLGALAHAASGIGAGRYGARVAPPGLGAEFDDLAAAFNRMADDLAEADRLRSRLLADVAHELRTPVATLVGYLEAVEDGVQPLDAGTVAVLRAQGDRLTRLAGDLAPPSPAPRAASSSSTGVP
ncbi:histidine kinase dimerization/phospho-acceptor domain-containing protein [Cellulomonas marina]|uniref:histidine kinase n=1 Tax=Cellulomonas marina TaxID=988821 RepID=A0A1I0YGM4_9CELL|nr:histidine kinase dimerization/phospho-acceptor domain-containing protein [Cellulomonas marina]GIG28722.1 hypothetical protein Cma02nite_13220 [Cellulomonas marina]SFB11896.1 HAMP domain-containing protein [Cellulomonas marina]